MTDDPELQAARAAEIQKLGENGPARIAAVTTWAKAALGETGAQAVIDTLWTAQQVERWERTIQDKQRAPQQQQQQPPVQTQSTDGGKVDEATYNRMSHGERLDYSRRFDQSQFQSNPNGVR